MSSEFEYIPTFLEAAKAGGKIVREYFGKNISVIEKTTAADLRTKADLESEGAILPILEKAFPEFNIFSEERGHTDKGSEYTIYVDPLDGTNNFFLGIPNFTVLISLLYGKECIAGLIYHPMTDLACYAEKGMGAFANGLQIHVNSENDPGKAAICFTAGYDNSARLVGPMMTALKKELNHKRTLFSWSGAADACLVACGKAEALINDGNEIFDYAANKLIVREAGGKITDLEGKVLTDDTQKTFLMSNGTGLHEKILTAWRTVGR